MASVYTNAVTLARNPKIAAAYIRWIIAGGRPRLSLSWGDKVSGFRHFSDYFGTAHFAPSASEVAFCRCALRSGGVALDIGANIGVFSLLMTHAGASAVHAFEPVPATRAVLDANTVHDPRIAVHHYALSDRVGQAAFRDHPRDHARNHLLRDGEVAPASVVVETTTIDDFCQKQGIEQIALAKIDVEGFEPMVLAGAERMLSEGRISALIIEIIDGYLMERGFDPTHLRQTIASYGYTLERLTELNFAGVSAELQAHTAAWRGRALSSLG